MSTAEAFYDINPITQIDQNVWDERIAELAMQFRQQPVVYTPMVNWDNTQQLTGAETTIHTEILEGDTDIDEIPFTANYIDVTTTVDSRFRSLRSTRYGDKVQLHESSNIFQQWNLSGGRDWRPLLRGLLGANVIRKHEMLARNAHLLQPQEFWTFPNNATSFATIGAGDTFDLDIINDWRLRLGATGNPVIPGDFANAKVVLHPPGVTYDIMRQLPLQAQNEASMWRDSTLYRGEAIRYEIGTHKGVRFVEVPNNRYGENLSILYNAGTIVAQYGLINAIHMGDGAPDPEDTTFKVDDVWSVGQKNVVHFVQLEAGANMALFNVHDVVSIHTQRTAAYGVTNGVDFKSGKTITRRIVRIDVANRRLMFDRPVMFNYVTPFVAASDSGAVDTTFYAFVTSARHIGFCLVLGARGGLMGSVARPIRFYDPKPVDDFQSVWRYVWDAYEGYNLWDPHLFECHFCAVSLPKVGGIITP
jgi:hypothetical protein